jgi:hypothetical protein
MNRRRGAATGDERVARANPAADVPRSWAQDSVCHTITYDEG